MRSIEEVNKEFSVLCAQIGQLEVQKTKTLSVLDAQLAPLHARVDELEAEAAQIKAVKEALAEQEAAKNNVASTDEPARDS